MASRIRDEDARALSRGSSEAFERVYKALSGPLYGFLRRATDDETARDLLQETWLRVIRAGRTPALADGLRPWAFRIACRLVADHWRGKKRSGLPLPNAILARPETNPEREVQAREMRRIIDAAIADLPEGQRAVFLLREEARIPFREVAEVLGIPLGTALARMRYALTRLRESLRRTALEADR